VSVRFAELQTLKTRASAVDFWVRLPIYARLLVRHPDPTVATFEFNGSLTKLGLPEKLAAEELVDQWTVQFLSGTGASLGRRNSKRLNRGSRII
jgi:hypothetical protein